MTDRLMTVREVAEVLGCNEKTVYRMTYRRELPFIKLGRNTKIRSSSLQRYLDQSEVATL